MTAIAALALLDGQATPVSHSFDPVTIDRAGVAYFADRSGGISLGYPVITQLTRQPVKGSRAVKVTGKVVTPVLEVTSPSTATGIQPAPTKAYDLMFSFDFVLPERATLAQKKDILAFAKNFLATTVITNAVQNGEAIY
jgi:hypothetical protein